MYVLPHAHLPAWQTAAEHGVAAADRRTGVQAFQVELRTLQPGACTGPLQHGGELVVVVPGGGGKLYVDGGPLRFTGPCTLLLPAGRPFELANTGSLPLMLVWVFTEPPMAA
jgi:mannose-6-phosphate isomerase-like protein (cupin superfamily)